jgi:hypothetical protein
LAHLTLLFPPSARILPREPQDYSHPTVDL